MNEERYLRMPQVQEIVPYSRASIYAMVSRGEFPAPVKLGGRASFWIESTVRSWANERIKQATEK